MLKNKKIKKSIEEENKLQKFFEKHYHYDGIHNGNVILYTRKKNSERINTIGFTGIDHLFSDINKRSYNTWNDYYFTKNTFIGSSNQKELLFEIFNIVIDIDIHYLYYNKIPAECEKILGKLFDCDDNYVKPASVIFTGRGLQLWFPVIPLTYKFINIFELVQKDICQRVKKALSDGFFSDYKIDESCSVNAAGLVRMPYTYNTKTNTMTTIRFYHNHKLDVLSYVNEFQLKEKKVFSFNNNFSFLSQYRLDVLKKLRDIRGEYREGNRNNYLYCLYCSCIGNMGHDKTMEIIYDFNDGFLCPMSKKEILSNLSTVIRKQYYISNEKIISCLSITEEEQEILKFYPKGQYHKKEKKFEHINKEKHKIILECIKKGFNKSQIAKATGYSVAGISKYLKKHHLKTKQETIKDKIRILTRKDFTVKEIMQKLDLPYNKVYPIYKKTKEKIKEKELLKIKKEEERNYIRKRDELIVQDLKEIYANLTDSLHTMVDVYYSVNDEFQSDDLTVTLKRKNLPDYSEKMEKINIKKSRLHSLIDHKLFLKSKNKKEILKDLYYTLYILKKYILKREKKKIAEKYKISMHYVSKLISKNQIDPEKRSFDNAVHTVIELLRKKLPVSNADLSDYNNYIQRKIIKKAKEKILNEKIKKQKSDMKKRKKEFAYA